MFYLIYHIYDVDGGFGDPVTKKDLIAVVEATKEQIDEFLATWNKPRIYDRPYGDLYEHGIVAEPATFSSLDGLIPYDPETRDWPDVPEDFDLRGRRWDGEKWAD